MEATEPRGMLSALIRERGESYAALSAWLGRNPAYLQQFVARGSPRRLAERDRRALASYFGVDEAVLGGPAVPDRPRAIAVPRYEAGVSAGPGALPGDRAAGSTVIDPAVLRTLGAKPADLSLVTASGDSMWPMIADGDELLVDHADRRVTAKPAVFVLRVDGVVLVKRLRRAGGRIAIASENPAAPTLPDRDPAEIDVIGRVIHLARRLR